MRRSYDETNVRKFQDLYPKWSYKFDIRAIMEEIYAGLSDRVLGRMGKDQAGSIPGYLWPSPSTNDTTQRAGAVWAIARRDVLCRARRSSGQAAPGINWRGVSLPGRKTRRPRRRRESRLRNRRDSIPTAGETTAENRASRFPAKRL